MAAIPAKKIFSVAQVNRLVAGMLAERFNDIWVVGEISGFKRYPSGHLYFVLKDEESQIQAVCFRDSARRLGFELRDGDLVVVHGRLEVYVPTGRYQLIADTIEPKGLGALQRAFEELKRKLDREGLFKEERKRSLPRLPRVVGIITSPAGAAIHDMLKILRSRRLPVAVLLYPVQVQGEGAAEQIVAALGSLNRRDDVEVVILARGGGSLEDLWPFNEEVVARAIAASRVPVITGIGHEVDFTIADFVADVRAPTPTAAAQLIVRLWEQLEQRLEELTGEMTGAIQERLFDYERRMNELVRHRGFELVSRRLAETRHRVVLLERRLFQAGGQQVRKRQERVNGFAERLNRQHPRTKLLTWQLQLSGIYSRLGVAVTTVQSQRENRLTSLVAKLDMLNPLAILSRGYAICQKVAGGIVRSVEQVEPGDDLRVRVADGNLACRVAGKMKGGESGGEK